MVTTLPFLLGATAMLFRFDDFLGAFKEKYEKELRDQDAQKDAFEKLKDIVNQHNHVLLLYAAKDTKHNQAVVLQQLLNT